MNGTKTTLLSLACLAGISLAGSAQAGQIFSQAELAGILGGNLVMEDFEGNGMLGSGQITGDTTVLNSTTVFSGYGPGLVQAGVDYMSQQLWWNDDAYFGLNTRTLADCSGWRGDAITISFTMYVDAFGFDMQGYDGYAMDGFVDVYDTSNNLITSAAVNGGFFGWQNAGGIGKAVVSATSGYIMLDNHGYGAAVPEPATMAALGLGLAALLRKRRR